MRLHFQEKPWDLFAVVGYTLVMTATLLTLGVGSLFGILLVFFVPGYALVAALFPGNSEIDWIERFALSFGLSVAVVPLLGLLLNFTPWGIRFAPIVGTIALFTVGVGCVAYWRRMHVPHERRLSLNVSLETPDWKEYSHLDKALTATLLASIVVAAGILAYVVTSPLPGERFTEFYILGAGGNASGYPTNLAPFQPGTVIVGITNHEAATLNYAVGVDLVGVSSAYNASCDCNETQEVNRTSLAWLNQTLADNRAWSQPYTFSINATGLWKLQFLLYKSGLSTGQKVHFFVRVS